MGTGSSRMDGATHKRTKVNRTKHRLASLFCGASSSSVSAQKEESTSESLSNSSDYCQQFTIKSPSPRNDSVPSSSGGAGFTSQSSPRFGPESSPESSSTSIEKVYTEIGPQIESSSKRKCLSDKEVISPDRIDAESKHYQQGLDNTVNSSCTGQQMQLSLNPNGSTMSSIDDVVSNDMPYSSPDVTSNSLQHEELGLNTNFEDANEVTGNHISHSSPVPGLSDPGIASQLHGDAAIQEVRPPGLGLVPDSVQARLEGNLVHVDVVSIPSSMLPSINNDVSNREARRNSRRMFWDAFSSRNSRRHAEFPAILFTAEDSDFMGSHRRWLLDIDDDFFNDGVGAESWHYGRRSRFRHDRRRNFRSEFRDRLRGAATESRHRTTCPLDLHPDGSCTCELDEEASALSSISRIVLLAEALFEVLDEIHRQPDSFSLSMLSVPAPESVVDSLPLRTYEKPKKIECGDDPDQCYICLVEYEGGDKIRVLPCHHEYHMACVDKWLKEIHGVCPLCRGDVRGIRATEGAGSSLEAVLT